MKIRDFILRLGWTVCGFISLCLFVIGGRAFFADLYASVAEQTMVNSSSRPVALHAAELSTAFAPWKAKGWSDYANSAYLAGETGIALAAISQGIYWMPADAEKWAVMARILIAEGRFDNSLKYAVAGITQLAPNSPRWREQLAFDGLYFWRQGDLALRKTWLNAMRDSLLYEKDRFLLAVLLARREPYFCEYTSKALNTAKWCEGATYWRRVCSADNLTRDQRAFCDVAGFVRGPAS
jgi:hypothetical protein